MLLLTDGTVMCHEYESANWHRLRPDSTGSYLNGAWSSLAPLPDDPRIPAAVGGPTNAPLCFASAVLPDGSVLVAGGEFNSECSDAADILSVHIYDPLKNVWTAVNAPAGWTGIGDAASVNNQRNE